MGYSLFASHHCLHLPEGASATLWREWPQVQLACASILRHRYAADKPNKPQPERVVDVKSQEPGEPLLPFRLSYTLSARRHPWLFTRAQWHRLTHLMSCVRIQPAIGEKQRFPSLVELYLSYLHMNGMICYHDEAPSENQGGTLTSQLASFALGLRSFSELIGSVPLLHPEGQRAPTCKWVGQFGVGQVPELAVAVVIPSLFCGFAPP